MALSAIRRLTNFFKFNIINFDFPFWSNYMDQNWDMVDALLANLIESGNFAGLWQNSTAYTTGQKVLDGATGNMYTVAVDHTTHATQDFATYFAANPTYYTLFTLSINSKVDKGGDTMTGKLILAASTTARAPINLPSAVAAPTVPAEGDLWVDGDSIQFYKSSAQRELLYQDLTNLTQLAPADMNLLDNTSFQVNQRGLTTPVVGTGGFVSGNFLRDRWGALTGANGAEYFMDATTQAMRIGRTSNFGSDGGMLQRLEYMRWRPGYSGEGLRRMVVQAEIMREGSPGTLSAHLYTTDAETAFANQVQRGTAGWTTTTAGVWEKKWFAFDLPNGLTQLGMYLWLTSPSLSNVNRWHIRNPVLRWQAGYEGYLPIKHRPLAVDLAACQRYLQILCADGAFVATAGAQTMIVPMSFRTQMWNTPSAFVVQNAGVLTNVASVTPSANGASSARAAIVSTGAGAASAVSREYAVSAELT